MSNPGFADGCGAASIISAAFNTKDLKKLFPEEIRTPTDAILQNQADTCDSNGNFNWRSNFRIPRHFEATPF